MARPRKSTAELKLNGNYRKDRHGKRNEAETEVAKLSEFAVGDCLEPPENITDEFVKSYYRYHTKLLIQLGLLIPADIPELNLMYEILQQERQIQIKLQKLDIEKDLEKYTELTKLQIKIINTFQNLCKKYFISPAERTHLELDNLQLEKAKNENQSIVNKILSKKNE